MPVTQSNGRRDSNPRTRRSGFTVRRVWASSFTFQVINKNMARDGIEPSDHMELQSIALPTELPKPNAGAGFEPTTFGLWARRATELLHPALIWKEDVGFEPYARFTRLTVFKTVPLQPDLGNPPINSPYGIRTRVTAVKGGVLPDPRTIFINGHEWTRTTDLPRLSGVRSNHLSYAPKFKNLVIEQSSKRVTRIELATTAWRL